MNKKGAENINSKEISAESVLLYEKSTDNFLCPLSANVYNIQFLAFKIRDYDSGKVFFEIQRDPEEEELKLGEEDLNIDENEFRTVKYHFGPNFFKLNKIGTTLTFSVGEKPVKNFRMIERHYFKDKLIKSFDFNFPFCMPNTTNTWESIYSLPELSNETINEMIANPWKTKADSFYFVENQLIMHNKSEYDYSPHVEQEEYDN